VERAASQLAASGIPGEDVKIGLPRVKGSLRSGARVDEFPTSPAMAKA